MSGLSDEHTMVVHAAAKAGADFAATAWSAASTASAAELTTLSALDDAEGARAWFGSRLGAFAAALSHDHAGRLRSRVERHALGQAAQDMIGRLVSEGDPPPAQDWPAEATLQPGQILANTYYVRALIARGGVGEVYRVRHRDLATEHAIKILQPRHALDPILVSMLLEEGRHVMRLRHPGIVAGHGVIRDADSRLLMVTELIRGSTLSARLRQGPLSSNELAALASALLNTLAYLHPCGIVHGDLSPDNIMLPDDRCADAKIIDFGVAHTMDDAQEFAPLVDFAGKFSWVAPEQLDGGTGMIDGRADLYSLGLVLAAAATGRRLDMGTDRPTALAARSQVPDLPAIPATWANVLRHLLAPQRGDRPANAEAVLAELAPQRRHWLPRLRRQAQDHDAAAT